MATAVDSLSGADGQKPSDVTAVEIAPTTTTQQPVALASEPAVPAAEALTTGNGTTIAHKKIIRPLDDNAAPKPDINDLLAEEEAKEVMNASVAAAVENQVVAPQPTVVSSAEVTPTPEASAVPQVSSELQAVMTEPGSVIAAPAVAVEPTPVAVAPPVAAEEVSTDPLSPSNIAL
jgi:hypothetical protein